MSFANLPSITAAHSGACHRHTEDNGVESIIGNNLVLAADSVAKSLVTRVPSEIEPHTRGVGSRSIEDIY